MKTNTRYKVTAGDSANWHDTMPDRDWIEDRLYICEQRGYSFTIHKHITTVNPDATPRIKCDVELIYSVDNES